MEKYDVAIAGAGIAGCLAARNLARAGHKVAVFERRTRETIGHDWWDVVRTSVFDDVGLPVPAPPERHSTCAPAVLMPPLETVRIDAPARPDALNIDRKHMARRLLTCAEAAGANLKLGTQVLGPIIENGSVTGLLIRAEDGSTAPVHARLTIDASGMSAALRSKVNGQHGFPRFMERKDMFVTHREIRENKSDSELHEIVFGKNNGVTWISREKQGYIDFFGGVINFPGRPSPRALVAEMVSRTPAAGKKVRGGHGAPIPVRHCFDSFVAPGFMLMGDAASQCNPMDGSGIESSLRAASYGSDTADKVLKSGQIDAASMWAYNAAYKRTQGAKFVALDAIQKFMVSEPKLHLELLFRRETIRVADFWGKGELNTDMTMQKIIGVLKLLDRPRFIGRLVGAMNTAKALIAHYHDYPETYDPATFLSWQTKKKQLFDRIPPVLL